MMQPEIKKLLYDIALAAGRPQRFSSGKTFDDYERDDMLRSAVERQFEIIGEAVSQLAKVDPDVANKISEHRRIIAFRNILIHGYALVDDRVVWEMLQLKLPLLHQQVLALLASM